MSIPSIFSGENNQPTPSEALIIYATQDGADADCSRYTKHDRVVSSRLLSDLATGSFKHPNYLDWSPHHSGIKIIGITVKETLNISRHEIKYRFDIRRSIFSQGIDATGTRFQQKLYLKSCKIWGEFSLASAIIKGQICTDNTEFYNSNHKSRFAQGEAVFAQDIEANDWFMREANIYGEFDMTSANIRGLIDFRDSKFYNRRGTAIGAAYVRIGESILLSGNNTKVVGQLDLANCKIGENLDLSFGTFIEADLPAIRLQDSTINGVASLLCATILGKLEAPRAHFLSLITFRGARTACTAIAQESALWGQRKLTPALSENTSSRFYSIILSESRIGGRLVLSEFRSLGIVDLSLVDCEILDDSKSGWPAPLRIGCSDNKDRMHVPIDSELAGADYKDYIDAQHFILSGFQCKSFAHPNGQRHTRHWKTKYFRRKQKIRDAKSVEYWVARRRIHWLTAQSANELKHHFNPQPWRMTSRVLRDMGYDDAANRVSIERRTRQRKADGTHWRVRLVETTLHLISKYGYDPYQAVVSAMIVIVFGAFVFWVAEVNCRTNLCVGPLLTPSNVGSIGGIEEYPEFNPLLHSLDLFIPVLDFNTESMWSINPDSCVIPSRRNQHRDNIDQIQPICIGWLVHLYGIFHRILGALIISMAIIGFTGLVKREER
ncbi:MAG: hypothetical protein H6843_07475 [Rhodospirillaceae bacterium]|nr:hypothetical protein [Rhodospirillaceae bacterium]